MNILEISKLSSTKNELSFFSVFFRRFLFFFVFFSMPTSVSVSVFKISRYRFRFSVTDSALLVLYIVLKLAEMNPVYKKEENV